MAKTKRAKASTTRTRKSGSAKKATASSKRQATGRKKAAASRAGRRKTTKTAKKGAKKATARKASAKKTSTRRTAKKSARKTPARKASSSRKSAASRKTARKAPARRGGSGREQTLSQSPETGRTVKGRTNPMRTRRSTGTPSGAGTSRSARLERERKQLRDVEETHEGPPSSLDMDRHASAARSGRLHMQDALEDHTETSPAMTGGDVDADWEDAYAVGDEAPGGDNPTPDQDRVEDIGRALGVTYDDNEELKGADKITERDKHRWELDPASSDDYRERD